ncbi:MAG: Epimerase [Candidatus Tokpelaia hoelldobleri]|uniref:Epimerase n=1 Tax=Candidatus Tokpelaia hoelldobleri TaxID=1902579 RepID=A0A1U9JW34_9HYPH|nr:MAG: Epimerase [Candidatus Tokpelaia hoelldoblerii]
MKAIVTGAAGFIGFHTARRLLSQGWQVVGVDNLNAYYDVGLKQARLSLLEGERHFRFAQADIADASALATAIGADVDADIIVHLAAQAGVRYSIENPHSYIASNVTGQVTVFEQALKMPSRPPVLYASSSSVYGANTKIPFSEADRVDQPVSVYAASKRAGELLAHSYMHVHGLRSTGLRFFTVYGPWGRPDMAPWLFTRAILAGEPIKLFNHGNMVRDFTYVDDVVAGIVGAVNRLLDREAVIEPFYNIGNNKPVKLVDFIAAIEKAAERKAFREMHPMPPADVPCTYADITLAERDLGYQPQMTVEEGMGIFVEWFRGFNRR